MPNRTTVRVCDILELVNRRNRTGTQTPEQREGANCLLESILHETGNYNGFGYLGACSVPPGFWPGIHFRMVEGLRRPDFDDTDASRVTFYASDALAAQARAKSPRNGSLKGIFHTMDVCEM